MNSSDMDNEDTGPHIVAKDVHAQSKVRDYLQSLAASIFESNATISSDDESTNAALSRFCYSPDSILIFVSAESNKSKLSLLVVLSVIHYAFIFSTSQSRRNSFP